ncbi:hypothetical protein ILUMI_03787 [Ignelater luminosus]|uniref:RING-type domain-containing protein n=1 Tax=Ignelater luminosus TaxID=2038154 RepID=A0A8K0DA41_IGNLU|nr:hypothetical protein ILUMI_03787 [Ignelater luminosus]
MNQKHVLVEHVGSINSVIKKPLQFTQRIKFTCFDVSKNYIVFGATSGGVYVFNRYPHAFIKLIPSKYGSVVQVLVSPTEKAIVLASSKGLIVVIGNCFTENNVEYQVYCEHEGNLITAMKWHSEEIYCGDDKGKISVITLPNLLTKAIFQAPTASLMQLNSPIVQIDCYSKFLLISTHSRTYICDTDKEQYRQIGKKLRDGRFGACFFACDTATEVATAHAGTSRGLFKNIKDDEQFLPNINDNVQIFCTRPGGRMWEAKMDATVTCTHQFKNYLKKKPTNVIYLDEDVNSRLKIIESSYFESNIQEAFNFTKVFVMEKRFILTFNRKGFYIFNPASIKFVCWCNNFNNIRDLKVIKNFIYIWNEKNEIHVIALYDLEKIILKTLFKKQYYISSELCANYLEDILQLVEISERIHLVSILKEKLAELQVDDLLIRLLPLFKAIEDYSGKRCSSQRLATGIVVVNNPYLDTDVLFEEIKTDKDQQFPETLQTLKEISVNVTDKLTESTKNLKEKFQILEATVKNLTLNDGNTVYSNKIESSVDTVSIEQAYEGYQEDASSESLVERVIIPQAVAPVPELDSNLKIFYQQYEVSKMNYNIEIPKFKKLLMSSGINNAVSLFLDFKEYMIKEKGVNEGDIQLWCYKNYLKYVSHLNFEVEIENLKMEDIAICYILDAFRVINLSPHLGCKCLFPLPCAQGKLPDYYEIGCSILNKFKIAKCEKNYSEDICRDVPFIWKFIISKLKVTDNINTLLPLLVQFGDEDLIKIFSDKFKYDTWDNAVQYLIKLKHYICINCDNKFKKCDIISWTNFATLIVQSIGGPSAIKLLMRYADSIPSNELNCNFYQSCIFATAIDNFHDGFKSEAINLTKTIQSNEDTALQFDDLMVRFLRRKCSKSPIKKYSGVNGYMDLEETDLKCMFCDLPFETPLLISDTSLECRHLSHTICLKYNKNVCKQCKEQK